MGPGWVEGSESCAVVLRVMEQRDDDFIPHHRHRLEENLRMQRGEPFNYLRRSKMENPVIILPLVHIHSIR